LGVAVYLWTARTIYASWRANDSRLRTLQPRCFVRHFLLVLNPGGGFKYDSFLALCISLSSHSRLFDALNGRSIARPRSRELTACDQRHKGLDLM